MRTVPAHVDKALRRKAQQARKSLNEVLRDALIREAEGTREIHLFARDAHFDHLPQIPRL